MGLQIPIPTLRQWRIENKLERRKNGFRGRGRINLFSIERLFLDISVQSVIFAHFSSRKSVKVMGIAYGPTDIQSQLQKMSRYSLLPGSLDPPSRKSTYSGSSPVARSRLYANSSDCFSISRPSSLSRLCSCESPLSRMLSI